MAAPHHVAGHRARGVVGGLAGTSAARVVDRRAQQSLRAHRMGEGRGHEARGAQARDEERGDSRRHRSRPAGRIPPRRDGDHRADLLDPGPRSVLHPWGHRARCTGHPGRRHRVRALHRHAQPSRRHQLRAARSTREGRMTGIGASGIDASATDSDFASPAAVDALAETAGRSRVRGAFRRVLSRPAVWFALAFLALVVACALFGHWFEPYPPNAIDVLNRNATPSWAHWLGTDDLGRDILSRIIAGAAIAVRVSVQSVGVAFVIAVPIGLASAYAGGWIDNVVMRFVDAALSFPALVLALAVAGVLGPSLGHAAIAISITMLPGFVRLVRGSALAIKHETYVEASRSIGVSTPGILLRRILPNIRSPLIVAGSLALGGALLAEAGLSFLGLSVQPPQASWGSMLRHAYDVSLFTFPWQLLIPRAAIALTILAINTVGDGLRDAFSPADTTGRRRRGSGGRTKHRRGLTTVVTPRPVPAAGTGGALLEVAGLTVQFDTP